MLPDERERLHAFLNQLVQVEGVSKDAEAESLIREVFSKQPDAPYLVVLRAMLLEQALEQAKAQIRQLQARPAGAANSFLNNPFGGAPYSPSAMSPAAQTPFQPAMPAQSSGWGGGGGGMSSFLGTAASVAAGVAGGSLLFNGLENLFDRSGSGQDLAAGNNDLPVEENIVNNYYGDGDNGQAGLDQADYDDSGSDGGDDSSWI